MKRDHTGIYRKALLTLPLVLGLCGYVRAQTVDAAQPSQSSSSSLPNAPTPQLPEKDAVTIRNTPIHILKDQAAIWTSPLHIRTHDLEWLIPLAAATGAGIATDHHVMSSVVSQDPNFNQTNIDVSNGLLGGFIAAPVALYGFGHFKDDEHAREAGILGGEALVDGVVVEQAMKLIFWRERPAVNNAHGLFFQSDAGVDSSFPSAHSVLAWSSAAVIAGEYPSHWTQLAVYTLATGVSLTRVLGQEHFPTDVIVGSAVGWLVGHYVYRAHHKPSVHHSPMKSSISN
ncbi:phosphatase PAP2 family protein [Tunturiibacter lichenicola]|uniref:phosphatase PAP2 family protein n=1 Tax=Tunturiibacter lichenicola TaxID=2051959 RepID=UPI003D9B8121